MNKFKRFLVAVLSVVTACASLCTFGACGGANSSSSSSGPSGPDYSGLGDPNAPLQAPTFAIPETGYDGSEQTVVFYHTMGQPLQEILNRYITKFNLLYPNITIDSQQIGGYEDVRDQIVQELIAKTSPNIAYCYPDHVALYNRAAKVLTLDDLIASRVEVTDANGNTSVLGFTDEQVADFIPGYYNEGKAFGNDKMYMLPFSKSTEVLYYDKTFFTEHNLSVPTTWDQMETLFEQIIAIDPDCVPLGYDSEANWFITMTEQLGTPYTSATGENFIFNTEANWEFVEKFRGWYQNGYVTTQELYGSYTSKLFTSTTGERSYMCIGSSAGASKQCPTPDSKGNFPFEVGITTIPQVNPETPKVISQGPSLCMFLKDNPQEMIATWLFMKYITTNVAFQAEFSYGSGYVPVLQSVVDNIVYKTHLSKANGLSSLGVTALAAKVCMEQAHAYYVSPAFYGSSVARDEVGYLMQACLANPPASGQSVRDYIKSEFTKTVNACKAKING